MDQVINLPEAEAQFGRLVERALSGEDIVIARGGTPLVRLVAVRPETGDLPHAVRKPGSLKHLGLRVPDSFFDPLPDDELDLWK